MAEGGTLATSSSARSSKSLGATTRLLLRTVDDDDRTVDDDDRAAVGGRAAAADDLNVDVEVLVELLLEGIDGTVIEATYTPAWIPGSDDCDNSRSITSPPKTSMPSMPTSPLAGGGTIQVVPPVGRDRGLLTVDCRSRDAVRGPVLADPPPAGEEPEDPAATVPRRDTASERDRPCCCCKFLRWCELHDRKGSKPIESNRRTGPMPLAGRNSGGNCTPGNRSGAAAERWVPAPDADEDAVVVVVVVVDVDDPAVDLRLPDVPSPRVGGGTCGMAKIGRPMSIAAAPTPAAAPPIMAAGRLLNASWNALWMT